VDHWEERDHGACVCVYVCVCTCMGIEEMMTGHEGKNHGGFCADVGRS
jgi:hypothetical protein